MTKLKGAAILGAITVAGVMLVSSFPASSATSGLLVSAHRLEKACETTGDVAPVCKFVAGFVVRVAALGLNPGDPIPSDVTEKALRKLRSPIKRLLKSGCCDGPCVLPPDECPPSCVDACGSGFDRCDNCVKAVSEIEIYLATNGTANFLKDTLESACIGRFPDQATTDECIGQFAGVPTLIDNFLTNFPPLTACQDAALHACPE